MVPDNEGANTHEKVVWTLPRVYLAARYSRREELQSYAEELQGGGFEVTSRWLQGASTAEERSLQDDDSLERFSLRYRQGRAMEDYEDVLACDALVHFSDDIEPGRPTRGGALVEFGMALAWEKRVIVCGPSVNIFHDRAGVEHYEMWEDTKDALVGEWQPDWAIKDDARLNFRRLWGKLLQLHARKNTLYSPGVDPWQNFRTAAEIGIEPWRAAFSRAEDKTARAKALASRDDQESNLANEPFPRTLGDRAVYDAIVAALWLDAEARQGRIHPLSIFDD